LLASRKRLEQEIQNTTTPNAGKVATPQPMKCIKSSLQLQGSVNSLCQHPTASSPCRWQDGKASFRKYLRQGAKHLGDVAKKSGKHSLYQDPGVGG